MTFPTRGFTVFTDFWGSGLDFGPKMAVLDQKMAISRAGRGVGQKHGYRGIEGPKAFIFGPDTIS